MKLLEAAAAAASATLRPRGDGYILGEFQQGQVNSFRVPGQLGAAEVEGLKAVLVEGERVASVGGMVMASVSIGTLDYLMEFMAAPYWRVELVLLSGTAGGDVVISADDVTGRVGVGRGVTLSTLYLRSSPGEFKVGQELRIPKSAVVEGGTVAQTEYELVDATSRVEIAVVQSGGGIVLEGEVEVRRVVAVDPATTELSSWQFFRPAAVGEYIKLGDLSVQDARVFLGKEPGGLLGLGVSAQATKLALGARVYQVRNDGAALVATVPPRAAPAPTEAPTGRESAGAAVMRQLDAASPVEPPALLKRPQGDEPVVDVSALPPALRPVDESAAGAAPPAAP